MLFRQNTFIIIDDCNSAKKWNSDFVDFRKEEQQKRLFDLPAETD